MAEPIIVFNRRLWHAQDLSHNPALAEHALDETAWSAYIYGIASTGGLPVYESDNVTTIPLDKLYSDAVSLSLGIWTIKVPHVKPCNRLICNCKIV